MIKLTKSHLFHLKVHQRAPYAWTNNPPPFLKAQYDVTVFGDETSASALVMAIQAVREDFGIEWNDHYIVSCIPSDRTVMLGVGADRYA